MGKNSLIHAIGCILFLSLPFLFSPEFSSNSNFFYNPSIHRAFISTLLLLLFFYLNYYVFIPHYYISKKYIVYTLLILSSFLLFFIVPELHKFWRPYLIKQSPPTLIPPPRPFINMLSHRLLEFSGVLIFSLLIKLRERLKLIEVEKSNAELSYLKAQINPHFLFNTLNSIYSLAIMKSDKTADSIAKISNMMRYVLNETVLDVVPLEKEKKYLDNYIDLQTIRLSKNIKFFYSWNGQCDNLKIAPLILITFIENAFKHGVNTEEESNIIIEVVVLKNEISLIVKNKIVSKNTDNIDKSGLGIDNTKMRLNLLYPKNHYLQITNDSVFNIVDLKINLHD